MILDYLGEPPRNTKVFLPFCEEGGKVSVTEGEFGVMHFGDAGRSLGWWNAGGF